MMSEKEIYDKIESTYDSEKGKGFITHLIRSFFPIGKGTYLIESDMTVKRCCLTKTRLISKSAVANAMFKTTPKEFSDYLKSSLLIDEKQEDTNTVIDHPAKKHLPNGALLGIISPDSDKMICQPAYEQLYNFYANRILSGDKHMNWLAKNMMAKAGITGLKQNGVEITKNEEKAVYKNVNKPGTLSLGDLDVLKNLKTKLENDEQDD